MFKLVRMPRVRAKDLQVGQRYRIVDRQGDTEDLEGTFKRHIQNEATKRILFAAFTDLPNEYYEEHWDGPEYPGDPDAMEPGEIQFTIDRFRFYTVDAAAQAGGRRKLRKTRRSKKSRRTKRTTRHR
jgi:hypothetical protein